MTEMKEDGLSPPAVANVVPNAARTISSLRDVGYELPQAVADLVDNSLSAEATSVSVDFKFNGDESWVRITDNGIGMDGRQATESLRYGADRSYSEQDLGKFGFGLKTASTSQCRKLTVATKSRNHGSLIHVRVLDLDHIEKTNRWEILLVDPNDVPPHITTPLERASGTVVVWEKLDRILDYADPNGGWAKKRLLAGADETAQHLGMVFHRFIAGESGLEKTAISVNGSRVDAWDPFCRDEPNTKRLQESDFKVASKGKMGIVHVTPYVLPNKSEFSTLNAWQAASGPLKWNRQQGLYVYRANRLIQWGGWSRLRTVDEHTKSARVAIDFPAALDSAFGINISKAIVALPDDLRDRLKPVVDSATKVADARYRAGAKVEKGSNRPAHGKMDRRLASKGPATTQAFTDTVSNLQSGSPPAAELGPPPPAPDANTRLILEGGRRNAAGLVSGHGGHERQAFEQAALDTGHELALQTIIERLKAKNPEVASRLGW